MWFIIGCKFSYARLLQISELESLGLLIEASKEAKGE